MLKETDWTRREWLILAGLLALALALRLAWLGHVPPGVRFDELVNVRMADHIYAGEWPVYFQEAWGHEPLYHYFQALGMSLFGQNVLGVRIASVVFGTFGALTTYLALRSLFGRAVATIGTLLLATSLWSLMYSRVGLRHISLPPWVGLAVTCFWRGLEAPVERHRRLFLCFALGGLCSGIALYTYFASRLVPGIFVAFLAYMLLFHRQALRGRWPGLLVFLLLPALVVAPMVLHLQQHPELEQRLGQVNGELLESLRAGDVKPLVAAVLDTLRMFSLRGDPEWLYNISGRPVLDPLTSAVFCIGLATSVWRWRDPRRAFLLIWLAVGVVPSLLSWPPGSLGHTIVAQPATVGLVALGTVDVWAWGRRRASRWLRWAGATFIATAIGAFVLLNTYDYFYRWPRFPEVRHEYQAPITAVARYLERHPDVGPAYVSAPYVDYWNPWSKMNLRLYLGDAAKTVRWFDGQQSLVLPGTGDGAIFLPDHILLPSGLESDLDALLKAGAQPVEIGYRDDLGSGFDLYRWTDPTPLERRLEAVSTARVWASPETAYVADESERQREALRLPLDFGHQLALLGYAYDRPQARSGEIWRVTTYWRATQADASPRAIFVHLLDGENAVRAGWDGLYVSPEELQPGDTFIHHHTLALPADLPAGALRVEVGVYAPDTLDRLPLFTGPGDETAPYNRALLSPLLVE